MCAGRHLRGATGGFTLGGMNTAHEPSEECAVEARDLRKAYGEVEAVRGA
jgi:hypothetical protein